MTRAVESACHDVNPVRESMLSYGHHWIDQEDIAAVVQVLSGEWLTTGPLVEEFEKTFAAFVGAREAIAVSSGTAALHAAMFGADIGPGDEVIVPAMTFAATANCVLFQGATPVFADVDRHTLLMDPAAVEEKITPRTRAIIAVDYTGQPCDYASLRSLAEKYNLKIVADACHSLGAADNGKRVGSVADASAFSLHPVKHITTGEGGVIATDDAELARRMRRFRNHGITTEARQRESWSYEMVDLGYNYRLTDFQCALGMSQLRKLPGWLGRRREIAGHYNVAFANIEGVKPLEVREGAFHAYHLYVVRLDSGMQFRRAEVFEALRREGIGVNVHYLPVHLHPFYRSRYATGPGLCPVAEEAYEQILSLPLFPAMTVKDEQDVICAMRKVMAAYGC